MCFRLFFFFVFLVHWQDMAQTYMTTVTDAVVVGKNWNGFGFVFDSVF